MNLFFLKFKGEKLYYSIGIKKFKCHKHCYFHNPIYEYLFTIKNYKPGQKKGQPNGCPLFL